MIENKKKKVQGFVDADTHKRLMSKLGLDGKKQQHLVYQCVMDYLGGSIEISAQQENDPLIEKLRYILDSGDDSAIAQSALNLLRAYTPPPKETEAHGHEEATGPRARNKRSA